MNPNLMVMTMKDKSFTAQQAVDPALRKVARFLPRGYALHRGYKMQRALMKAVGNAGRINDVPVVTVNDHVTVRLHRHADLPDKAPALLWIHGGGTLMGVSAQDDKYCRKLSHLAGVAVAAVEHRLAPEHPYPTPLEDCYAALLWLARQPWVDPQRSRSAEPARAGSSPRPWRNWRGTEMRSNPFYRCCCIRCSTTARTTTHRD